MTIKEKTAVEIMLCGKVNYLLKATVIVSVELAHGQRASGFKPLASKAFTKESQADKDPRKNNI